MVGHQPIFGASGAPKGAKPLVSVIMANYQGGPSIAQALSSVSNQTVTDIEIIVSDDASDDDSVAQVRSAMRRDPRIRLVESADNGGPARARNKALALSRGEWIAIVDADDLIHPERLERLLALAAREDADIVADDLLHFYEDARSPSHYLLPDDAAGIQDISAETWILSGSDGIPSLGYLKPLIRASVLGDIRYDETLRIGEDYDLILRLLLGGAVFKLTPVPWYLYRRHARSLSYRLGVDDVGSMIDSQRRFVETAGPFSPSVAAAFSRRMRGLATAHAFARLVEGIKRGAVVECVTGIIHRPALLLRLAKAAAERFSRVSKLPVVSDESAHGPRTLALATAADATAPTSNVEIVHVPPYQSADTSSVPLAGGRRVWRDLADLGKNQTTEFLPVGMAGRYAAGFIPAAFDVATAEIEAASFLEVAAIP